MGRLTRLWHRLTPEENVIDTRGWLDRLLNRPIEQAKAATGPGVIALQNDIPLWRLGDGTYVGHSRRSQRLMKEAQQVAYANPWIRAAERAISSRGSTAPWHFEDRSGKKLGDEEGDKRPSELTVRLMALLEKPSKRMTGRALKHITLRHVGVVGNACWFLDSQDIYGLPEAIYYLNPARLVPLMDTGGNLASWSLDPTDVDGSGGTRLRPDEVLHFQLEPPDWGVWAIGLVESAQTRIALERLTIAHATNTFAAGGRLPGIIGPKEGSLNPEQQAALERDVRNIVELPDASKRTLVASGPLDFTATAQTATELQLYDVAKMGRDDVEALWGVPLSQLGIATPQGLNGGERGNYEEAVLWQGAIHPRLDILREMVQFRLADKLPDSPQLVVEEPEFDDQTPRYEMADKARVVPMTNKERREILGLEPFPKEQEELNNAVYLPKDMVRIDIEPLPIVTPPPPTEETSPELPEPEGKARSEPFTALRGNVEAEELPRLQKALSAYLAKVKRTVAGAVRQKGDHIRRKSRDSDAWWDGKKWDGELRSVMEQELRPLAEKVSVSVTPLVKKAGKADDDVATRAIALVLGQGAEQVTGINETTRERLALLISEGIEEGLSASELGDRIEASEIFDEARAEMIARTEFGRAYNSAALETYGGYGIEQVQAIDGDEDAECAARNGLVLSRHEASGITDHPNGTLDWVPVL